MTNHRFVLVHNENVIDTSKSNSKVQYSDVYSTSEKSLRESVLIHRLKKFVDKLLLNDNPDKQNPHWERPHEDPENFSLAQIIFHTVIASRLNARDETSPLKLRFDGKQHRIVRWQDSSSISLFITDVDCVLRDVFGVFDDDVIRSTREAIFVIVQHFLRFARNDLWLEHQSVVDLEYICGVPKDAPSASDYKRAEKAVAYLSNRLREFRANPRAFSQYTARFLKTFEEHP
jgi:hypothetical protein